MSLTLTSSENISIRLMQDSEKDYELMAKWLADPKVLEFYEGRDNPHDLIKVKEKYSVKILNNVNVFPCILELDNKPLGYIQFYELEKEQKIKFELSQNELSYGIDMFIGETSQWNKGLGSKYLILLVEWIFKNKNLTQIIVDPRVENIRAIRAYEKVGFTKVKVISNYETWEGRPSDNWLMILSNV